MKPDRQESLPAQASQGAPARLRLLLLEDSPVDTELEVTMLEDAGFICDWQRVQTRQEFVALVESAEFDLILADYTLPAFDGLSALHLVRSQGLDVPFVLISGTIGEEIAIECLKAGATDYVLKDRLRRLVPVVQRALAERTERRQREQAEVAARASDARYRELFENANDIVYTRDLDGNLLSINKAGERLTGFSRDQATTMNIAQFIPAAHLEVIRAAIARQIKGETVPAYEQLDLFVRDGRLVTIEANERLIYENGQPLAVQGIARDITARKRAEADKAALLDVAREATGTLDLAQLLDRVQRLTARVLPCDAVATLYWDPVRQVFRVIAHHGVPAELVPFTEALALRRDVQWKGRPVGGTTLVLNDIAAESWWPIELHTHLPVASLVAAPLHVHGRQLGALVGLRTTSRRGFEEEEVQLCVGIAQQLALGLESVELYRDQREEAHVSGALVRVGRELISSLDTPALLNRLCQLVTHELGCDFSHVLLAGKDTALSIVAGFGDAPEHWEGLQLLRVPRDDIGPLLQRLNEEEVAVLNGAQPALNWLAAYHGAKVLYVALRRREAVVGILIAGCRGRKEPLRSQQRRILRGIGQLASMALENAYLFEELEWANRLKSDFVATMSHELRTPLNIIMGYGDLLREGEFGPMNAEQLDTLSRMDHSAKNLLELVNATLDVSRFEGGRSPLQLREVAVPNLMAEVQAESVELCRKGELNVTWKIAPQLPVLWTDPVKLKVVIKNLIANAVKFTPSGEVTIGVSPRGDGVEVAVTDTGIGISPEVMPIIFEPFRQGESTATRRFGGVGLGLYIAQRLVNMLGASISVESEVGRGSTFRVVHPRTAGGKRAAPGVAEH